jgi:hypothetical protein
MRKLSKTIAAALGIVAFMTATLASASPYDRHLYPSSTAETPISTGGWPDGTAGNTNF